MKKERLKDITSIAIVAALYVALTLVLYPLSYGSPQFRVSECLVLLTYFNKKHGIGVSFGVLIANFLNPEFAILDMIFGTLSTIIAVILIINTKKLFIASLMPVMTSIIVVFEVWYVTKINFFIVALEIIISMFIIESIIGYILFKILSKNSFFLKIVNNERSELS